VSGGFDLSTSRTVEQLVDLASAGRIQDAIVPAADLLPEFPSEYVDAATAAGIRQGRDFRVSPFRVSVASAGASKYVKALSPEGDLLAIGEARLPNVYHPILVL
jgi:tRNA pseudouridine55 synthase